MARLPRRLCRSLTWDHGKEMAEHARFTTDTGVPVFFCDPAAPGSGPATRTPTGWCANTCPGPLIYAASARPTWTASPPNSTAALDRSLAFRHPHAYSQRHCADPLRPPPFLRQPPLPAISPLVGVQNSCPKSTSHNRPYPGFCDRSTIVISGPPSLAHRVGNVEWVHHFSIGAWGLGSLRTTCRRFSGDTSPRPRGDQILGDATPRFVSVSTRLRRGGHRAIRSALHPGTDGCVQGCREPEPAVKGR
jgi:hypothetical protein